MPPKILDCTLRDGGYVNHWNFSKKQARDTIVGLIGAGIDIIECGFLDATYSCPQWNTRFSNLEMIDELFVGIEKKDTLIVAMIEYGKFDIDTLPNFVCEKSVIGGIRFSFRRSDWKNSLEEMKKIVKKGYRLFVQPITTNSYPKEELQEMLSRVRELEPFAVYIVDTQGSMYEKDVSCLFGDFDRILQKTTAIGFHSHNNMQLSYANAISFVSQQTDRELIVDASIYGMGRGAGNLNTELFATFLNQKQQEQYDTNILWNLIDTYYHAMHSMFGWGYSIFHYLSASIGCHPDYASYLLDKKHLLIEDIKTILEKIPQEYLYEFNKKIIEDLYFSSNACHHSVIREPIIGEGQRVILIGSGGNIQSCIKNLQKEKAILIALNHIPQELKVNYVFFNSTKRYLAFSECSFEGIGKIFSSNLEKFSTRDDYLLDYEELTTLDGKNRSDNSVIMLINYFVKRGFSSVELAGIDGFNIDDEKNYAYQEFDRVVDKTALININEEIGNNLSALGRKIKINFLTKSIFDPYTKRS